MARKRTVSKPVETDKPKTETPKVETPKAEPSKVEPQGVEIVVTGGSIQMSNATILRGETARVDPALAQRWIDAGVAKRVE